MQEANLGAVNYHKVELEGSDARRQRTEDSITDRRASDEKKSTKEATPDCRNGAQMAKNLDDDG